MNKQYNKKETVVPLLVIIPLIAGLVVALFPGAHTTAGVDLFVSGCMVFICLAIPAALGLLVFYFLRSLFRA